MKENGVVYAKNGSEVLVRLKRHSGCFSCRACSKGFGDDMVIKAIASDGVKVGDKVAVEIDSILVFKAIVMVYLLPTAAFLAGISAGLGIAALLRIHEYKEAFSLLIGLVLLCASLIVVRHYGIKRQDAYQAKITGVIKD